MRMLERWKNLLAMRTYREVSSAYPQVVGIETSSVCNLSCPKCPVSGARKPRQPFIEPRLFEKIIEEVAGRVDTMVVSYFGEPLLHPEFWQLVGMAKSRGLRIQFYTNAVLLDQHIDNFKRYSPDHVLFSVDSIPPDFEFYRKMKGHNGLTRVVENVIGLAKAWQPERMTCIRLEGPGATPKEVYERFWKAFGVQIMSGPVNNWGGSVSIPSTARRVCKTNCSFPYFLNVHSDGIIPMCHMDFNGDLPLGNAASQSIREIYNGAGYRELRRKLKNGDIRGLPCERCQNEGFLIPKRNVLWACFKELIKEVTR